MSLQDDYFDLSESLTGWQKDAFLRIWEAFVDMENEHESLLQIRGSVRRMIELTFPPEEKPEEMVLVDDSASTVERILVDCPQVTTEKFLNELDDIINEGFDAKSVQSTTKSNSEAGFAKLIEEANEYMSCMTLSISEHGLSVELMLDTSIGTYGEWIQGEGGDICLLRCIKTDRVIGCNLPLMNRRLSVHHSGPIVINDGFRVEKQSTNTTKIIDAIENLTMSQWKKLMSCERKIIESDDNQQKTIYVNELYELEKNYGVFVSNRVFVNGGFWINNQPCIPRWQSKPSHLCGK